MPPRATKGHRSPTESLSSHDDAETLERVGDGNLALDGEADRTPSDGSQPISSVALRTVTLVANHLNPDARTGFGVALGNASGDAVFAPVLDNGSQTHERRCRIQLWERRYDEFGRVQNTDRDPLHPRCSWRWLLFCFSGQTAWG
ncbi:hypothetical protein XA68_11152 [Ophiocordyceps unilateralis]|uniref:Uncharacterized protein n=1 Tax=Ophiocordyceps unilateralis TaxID=268505 RepID=A0A2A9PHJ9_OPHUN|nr:hypothetical protein XA68_11152 [Ophiocordyceps unilateralis]